MLFKRTLSAADKYEFVDCETSENAECAHNTTNSNGSTAAEKEILEYIAFII